MIEMIGCSWAVLNWMVPSQSYVTYWGMRMVDRANTLAQHLATKSWRNIFTLRGQCVQALMCRFWTNQSYRFVRPVWLLRRPAWRLVWLIPLLEVTTRSQKLQKLMRPRLVIGEYLLQNTWSILVVVHIGEFGVWYSNTFWLMMSFKAEPPKIYFFNAWIQVRPKFLRGKFVKASVEHINQFLRWSSCLWAPISIFLAWLSIVYVTTRDAKSANNLVICSWCPLRWCILLSSYGCFKDGVWTLLGRFILLLQEDLASCWWLQIISSGSPQQYGTQRDNWVYYRSYHP